MKFQNRVPKYPFKCQYCFGYIYIKDLFIVTRSRQMFFAQLITRCHTFFVFESELTM